MIIVSKPLKMLFTHSGLAYTQSPILSPIWNSSSTWSFWQSSIFSSFVDLVWYIIEEDKDLVWFAMLAWSIWNSRNCLCTTSHSYPLSQLQPKLLRFLNFFSKINQCYRQAACPYLQLPLDDLHLLSLLSKSTLMKWFLKKQTKQV